MTTILLALIVAAATIATVLVGTGLLPVLLGGVR